MAHRAPLARGALTYRSLWLAMDAEMAGRPRNQEEIRRIRPDSLAKESRVETLGPAVESELSPAQETLAVLSSCPAQIRF